MPRSVLLIFAGLACLLGAIGFTVWQAAERTALPHADAADAEGLGASGPSLLQNAQEKVFAVSIRKPAGPPRVELAGTDPQGRTGSVACSTCHNSREANLQNVSAATLDEFHQGMAFQHGNITCYACHHPDDSDSLRLADGSKVAYQDVMTLCSQCHGPQATAFAHGAHGGMNGHWDLSQGPQTKNNCIDCHDPHAPSYPRMIVGFKPKDRFNEPSVEQEQGGAAHGDH